MRLLIGSSGEFSWRPKWLVQKFGQWFSTGGHFDSQKCLVTLLVIRAWEGGGFWHLVPVETCVLLHSSTAHSCSGASWESLRMLWEQLNWTAGRNTHNVETMAWVVVLKVQEKGAENRILISQFLLLAVTSYGESKCANLLTCTERGWGVGFSYE